MGAGTATVELARLGCEPFGMPHRINLNRRGLAAVGKPRRADGDRVRMSMGANAAGGCGILRSGGAP